MISKRRCTWWLALLLAVPLVAGGAVAAQSQGEEGGHRGQMGPGGRRGPVSPDDRLKHMTKDFKLTTGQQTKIKPILEAEQKKMQDLMNDPSGDREYLRAKMQEIQQDVSKQVRDLLDDKQHAPFDNQYTERRHNI